MNYKDYVKWCEDMDFKPSSEEKFETVFKKLDILSGGIVSQIKELEEKAENLSKSDDTIPNPAVFEVGQEIVLEDTNGTKIDMKVIATTHTETKVQYTLEQEL